MAVGVVVATGVCAVSGPAELHAAAATVRTPAARPMNTRWFHVLSLLLLGFLVLCIALSLLRFRFDAHGDLWW
jgi:hypothetical protein